MRKILLALTLIATLVPLAAAQDGSVPPPVILGDNTSVVSGPLMNVPGKLPFCPPKTCLYYAGDSDSSSGGLFNADYEAAGLEGQVWMGVKPTKNATVTGGTFNEFLTSGYTITNPTPFQLQINVAQGKGGELVCNTSGNATMTVYGEGGFGLTQYSYTIKKSSKPCKLEKGKVYYVNLLPTSDNGYGYVVAVGAEQKNHTGWPNQNNACFFNGQAFGADYTPCGGIFSIALTGTE